MSESPVPKLNPEGLKDKKPKDYLLRFLFGASISAGAALIGLKFPLIGGMFLAFPAILPASLTLVERDSGRKEAVIDAEGAIIGALGLLAFALVAAFGMLSMPEELRPRPLTAHAAPPGPLRPARQ